MKLIKNHKKYLTNLVGKIISISVCKPIFYDGAFGA